jgi:hypothetical protein
MSKRNRGKRHTQRSKVEPATTPTEYYVWNIPAFQRWLEKVGALLKRDEPSTEIRAEVEGGLELFRNWNSTPEALRAKVMKMSIELLTSDARIFAELQHLGIVCRVSGNN